MAVTGAVENGDLIVEGDADGAIEIVAVSAGAFRVTDNGVVVADETVLTGVTDDVHIKLEATIEGTNDIVSIDLAGQSIDRISADLGDGDNSFEMLGGTAGSLVYRGGDGNDSVSLMSVIESRALVSLGDGDNNLIVNGEVGNLTVRGGDGADDVEVTENAVVTQKHGCKTWIGR